MQGRHMLIGAAFLFLTSMALAQPDVVKPAATQPATTQSAAIDQTTPRGALKVLTLAMNKGDPAGIKAVFSPASPTETKMVDAVISQQQALSKFRDSAVTAFGADEAKKLVGDVDSDQTESLAKLDAIPVTINGDTADVGEGDQILHLKKIGDQWTLPVAMLAPQITADNVDAELGQMSDRTKIFTDVSDEMANKKYKTTEEVGKALQLRMLQQVMAHNAAASQPTTEPAAPAVSPMPQ
jgi:hypothetical protein